MDTIETQLIDMLQGWDALERRDGNNGVIDLSLLKPSLTSKTYEDRASVWESFQTLYDELPQETDPLLIKKFDRIWPYCV